MLHILRVATPWATPREETSLMTAPRGWPQGGDKHCHILRLATRRGTPSSTAGTKAPGNECWELWFSVGSSHLEGQSLGCGFFLRQSHPNPHVSSCGNSLERSPPYGIAHQSLFIFVEMRRGALRKAKPALAQNPH